MTMTRNKKVMITIISIVGVILIAAVSVLTTAAVLGRKLTVSPSRELAQVDETVENALWYSSIAANSHNAQAWKVKLYPNENRAEVQIDDERTLGAVDPEKRETYLSLGCYLETMRVAFDAYGYDSIITYAAETEGFKATLTYTLRANASVNHDLLSLIDKRHTDKSAYSSDKIAQDTVSRLLSDHSTVACYQNGEENFEYLKKGTIDAVTTQSADQAYRDELAEWLRFSDKEAEEKLDGITADMMGLKGIVKTFYYWTTTRESATEDKFAKQGISTAKKQAENCGAFFVVTGGNTPGELVDAGRRVQAFWFDCARYNISIQPMSAMLETQPFAAAVQEDLGTAAPVQMILRAGYVKNYGINSGLRRSLSDYIEVFA